MRSPQGSGLRFEKPANFPSSHAECITSKGRRHAGRIHNALSTNTLRSNLSKWARFEQNDAILVKAKGIHMLSYAITFLIIAIIAGVLGFVGIAGLAAEIARILFFVFLVLFVVSLVAGRRPPV